VYQELQEELKVIYLEYDRLRIEIEKSRESAKESEAELRHIDKKASPQNLQDMDLRLTQLKAYNASLRDKWNAYHLKGHKIKVDIRIHKNREAGKRATDGIYDGEGEFADLNDKLLDLQDQLGREERVHHRRVELLMETIDKQRRRIAEHLQSSG
jgi:hypothetical protein